MFLNSVFLPRRFKYELQCYSCTFIHPPTTLFFLPPLEIVYLIEKIIPSVCTLYVDKATVGSYQAFAYLF